jgi:hypothetical protein
MAVSSLGLAAEIEFNRDVRPILSNYCFHCHGPDSHSRKAGLRLDTYEGATLDNDGIQAVVPGDLAASELIARIKSADPDEIMPPPESKKEMSAAEIKILEKWIKSGAEYQEHWAFMPPKKAKLPKQSVFGKWGHNEIDRFVHQELRDAKLKPQKEADKARLLRRVSLDLTGLPPTPEELSAFLADKSSDAYEKAVDRLLASPHYGERMTLAWMDAARYGDSSVMHADGPRFMWPWRDWVIDAYNNNLPFDQFAIEQLAGDLMPNATPQQKLATGFNRNHATSDEGGAFPEELRVEYVVDRVKTTANVFLGLSMECGQCHDHKFDPITQEEYFKFFAFFNNNADPGMQTRRGNQAPVVKLPVPERETELSKVAEDRKALKQKIAAHVAAAQPRVDAWIAEKEAELAGGKLNAMMPAGLAHHFPLNSIKGGIKELTGGVAGKVHGKLAAGNRNGDACLKLDGRAVVDFKDLGDSLENDGAFTLAAWIKPQGAGSGAVFSKMKTAMNYRGYDLWLQSGHIGTHVIHTWPGNAVKVVSKARVKSNTWQHVAVSYDGSGKAAGVKIYIDGKLQQNTVEQDGLHATIKTDAPFRIGARFNGSNYKGEVDDVRVYERALGLEEVGALVGGGDVVQEILAVPAAKRTLGQKETLANQYLASADKEYDKLQQQLRELGKRETAINKKYPDVDSMIMADNAPNKMRKTYILDRGAYDSPRKDREILPGTPEFLPPMAEDAPRNRLGMAQWLMSKDNPLTARVAVNRYWAMLFGRGLVTTVMDLGNQGAPPTHPELLDWLAVDFMESDWDVKRMLKKMVMSATYRQSAVTTEKAMATDPENRLLSRGARFRLQGEFIRDQALAVSGLLNKEIGGASVKPYQPPGIWNEVSLNGGLRYKQDSGEKLFRRSMYTYWKRSAPAPNMVIFDAPTREKCIVERARTNTPLQALVTLNDAHFVEASRKLAARVMTAGEDFEERTQMAFRLVLSREADAEELAVCRQVYEEQLASFKGSPEKAESYLKHGESKRDVKLPPAQHAAFTVLMNMLLNLDEALTRG